MSEVCLKTFAGRSCLRRMVLENKRIGLKKGKERNTESIAECSLFSKKQTSESVVPPPLHPAPITDAVLMQGCRSAGSS